MFPKFAESRFTNIFTCNFSTFSTVQSAVGYANTRIHKRKCLHVYACLFLCVKTFTKNESKQQQQ